MSDKYLDLEARITLAEVVQKFEDPPVDYPLKERQFMPWTLAAHTKSHWYQGEIDEQGQADGRGIELAGGSIYIGHRKNGEQHGNITWIYHNGKKEVGTWKEDQRHGQFMLTYPIGHLTHKAGAIETQFWQNDNLVQTDI